jgi:hypothetical protein
MRGVRGAKERRNAKRKSVSKDGSRGSRPREAEGGGQPPLEFLNIKFDFRSQQPVDVLGGSQYHRR